MKKFFLKLIFALLVCLVGSCVSSNKPPKPYEQKTSPSDDIISTINIEFEFYNNGWDTQIHSSTKEFAYVKLAENARGKYDGSFEIKDIKIILIQPPNDETKALGTFYATGVVVSVEELSGRSIGVAINKAVREMITGLPENTIIAVINISSSSMDLSLHAVDEIEYNLFSSKMTIVDRRILDRIRSEQNFQMSGEVSDDSAVSIGKMLGANVVLTGSITETASVKRINIRALDVKTAKIMTMARETFR